MLKMTDLSFSLHHHLILENIQISVEDTEFCAIIGPNGAGKSTLLKILARELLPSSGNIYFLQKNMPDWPNIQLARKIAVLPQFSQLNFPFRVRDVVAMGRTPHTSGIQVDSKIIDETLAAMDITDLQNTLYTQLSGGEKQRVQLARVLTQIWRREDSEQRLLLLDEPTTALDIEHQHLLMRSLRLLSQHNLTIIMVMHDFNLAAQYANRIITLQKGRVYSDGKPHEVFKPQLFSDVFNIDATLLTHPHTHKPIVAVL